MLFCFFQRKAQSGVSQKAYLYGLTRRIILFFWSPKVEDHCPLTQLKCHLFNTPDIVRQISLASAFSGFCGLSLKFMTTFKYLNFSQFIIQSDKENTFWYSSCRCCQSLNLCLEMYYERKVGSLSYKTQNPENYKNDYLQLY